MGSKVDSLDGLEWLLHAMRYLSMNYRNVEPGAVIVWFHDPYDAWRILLDLSDQLLEECRGDAVTV